MTKISNITKRVYSGGTPDTRKKEYWNGGIKWLSSGETRNNFIYDTEKKITELGVSNSSTKLSNKGSIVMACAGQGFTRGQTSYLMNDMYINQSVICIEPDEKKVEGLYLYYFFKNNYQVLRNLSDDHSSRGSITTAMIKNLDVNFPAVEVQKKISCILYSLDKKIELNNEINNTLSEQMQIMFYEWFESKINSVLPDGWKIVKLQDVSSFSQGVQIPIEEQNESAMKGLVRFIRIVDITQGSDKEIRYIKARDRGRVVENEIFMTRYGTPGILSRNYNGIIANNLFKISPSKCVTSNYLFSALNVDRIQNYIRGNAISSTMPAISFSTLNNQKIIIPDKEMLGKFDKYSETIRLKQLNIINENKRLQQLRDALLPKLMNDEIDLDNVDI